MTAVGGVEQVSQAAPGAIGPRVPFTGGPAVDTDPPGTANVPRSFEPQLPPGNGPVDYGLAQSALLTMRRNVGVDYGRIAALMVLIDSELARAARDARVMQIEAVTRQLHAVADDLRKSATLALAGGVVSSGMQMISAGISIGGGVKGMTLTRAPSAANAPSPNAAGTPPAPATTATTAATSPAPATAATTPATPASASPAPSPPAPASPSPGSPAPGSPAPGSPTTTGPAPTTPADTAAQPAPTGQQTQADATAVELTDAQQLARLAGMDHTVSQLLSARSQNVVLISQGLSMLASSSGEFIKTVLEHEARQTEADIKEDEAKVEEQRSYMDNTKAFGDSMQKSAHDMLQILQQIQEGLHQTSRNIWSRA